MGSSSSPNFGVEMEITTTQPRSCLRRHFLVEGKVFKKNLAVEDIKPLARPSAINAKKKHVEL